MTPDAIAEKQVDEDEEQFRNRVLGYGQDDTDYDDGYGEIPEDEAEPVDLDEDLVDDAAREPHSAMSEACEEGEAGGFDVVDGLVNLDNFEAAADTASRCDRKVARGFAALAAGGVALTLVAAVMFYSHDSAPAAPAARSISEPQAIPPARPAPPPPPAAPAAGVDHPLAYTADALGSCAPGSTAAQTMASADENTAFVCVRGGADGQTILIDLGRSYVINAIALEPGWLGKDATGAPQWLQHRVVSLVDYMFNDTEATRVTHVTGNVHGEALQPIKHVTASQIRILIRQTSRPPAEPVQPPPADNGPGGLMEGLGVPTAPGPTAPPALPFDALGGQSADTNSDPVDATFAIGKLKIIGHEGV
ncbi:hypothetical protein A5710_14410 [Mycolicibacter sinensis]|uniref:F5/8 type C domain-containing protein n=1 Tax=Mycolicibacter sinensis (strain JDM601) TaxID=875328 RepID=A0A1A2Y496_MYCSD|nr:hypothetical protein A5710_14410 [Mycolicibacter sinensis]